MAASLMDFDGVILPRSRHYLLLFLITLGRAAAVVHPRHRSAMQRTTDYIAEHKRSVSTTDLHCNHEHKQAVKRRVRYNMMLGSQGSICQVYRLELGSTSR